MEKVETKIVNKEEQTHHFYCDDCGDYLGSTEEYEDGYYDKLGKTDLDFHLPHGQYSIDKCLCDKCKAKIFARIANVLSEVGFKLVKD